MNGRALVIGEALIDVVVAHEGSVREHVGGSPANVAIGLGRLGRDVTLISKYGDDERGRLIDNHLRDSSVDTIGGLRRGETSSTAIATLDSTGSAHYEFDLRWDIPEAIDAPTPLVVHTGSIGAYLQPGHDGVVALLETHHPTSTITFDPNLRPALMQVDTARERVERLVAISDVVKVSDEDLTWIYPDAEPETVLNGWLTRGPRLVVLTRGGDGADAWTRDATAHVDRIPVAVVDTVGAGDSFMSALIDALWSESALGDHSREALAALSADRLQAVLQHANRAAAITVSRAGAQPPTSAELDAAS